MASALLYNTLNAYSAAQFHEDMDEAVEAGGDVVVRICGDGGEPEYGYACLVKIKEVAETSDVKIKIDGKAFSMYCFMCCYGKVESIDSAQFIPHRASYGEYLESIPSFMNEARVKNLVNINNTLKAAFVAKVDKDKFEAIAKITVDKMFAMTDEAGNFNRPDVVLTAKQAKQIGLIDSIVQLTPPKKKEITALHAVATARYTGIPAPALASSSSPEKNKDMDIVTLRAEHPALIAQIETAAITAAIKKERDRVGAWLTYAEIDLKAVAAGISSEDAPSMTTMAEMNIKMFSPDRLKALAAEKAKPTDTKETPIGEEAAAEAEKAKADNNFLAEAGIKGFKKI